MRDGQSPSPNCAIIRWRMYRYSPGFFAAFAESSMRSAAIAVPLVKSLFPVGSVADFGCGPGAWLAAWQRLGVEDIIGCDGPYLDRASLQFDASLFVAADLATAVRLGRRFDLVQSLEVAEHLPASAATTFVDILVSHAPVVLFSAAPPGQGGEHHVNEQPLEYWRAAFRQRGFHALDALRPLLAGEKDVAPWYRYNSILYVEGSRIGSLPATLRSHIVPDGIPVRQYAPLVVRMRNNVLRHIPEPVVTRCAAALRSQSIRRHR
jgi:hypothetical protein